MTVELRVGWGGAVTFASCCKTVRLRPGWGGAVTFASFCVTVPLRPEDGGGGGDGRLLLRDRATASWGVGWGSYVRLLLR